MELQKLTVAALISGLSHPLNHRDGSKGCFVQACKEVIALMPPDPEDRLDEVRSQSGRL
jgi:hypothetical protein